MKNKFIAYGAITFVLGGCVCYYLKSPKKKSYEISQYQIINIEQQILQQVCDRLGISQWPVKLNSQLVLKLHKESINICRDQLIGISIIKRQQRRQYVEFDVQQYCDITINELTAKRNLLLDVMKQIINYGQRDVLEFQQDYKMFLDVQFKLQLEFNMELLRFKCQDTKILDKEQLIQYLDSATEYLEQHSPQLFRFLKFIDENVEDKITGITLLITFSDDNVFFSTGIEESTVKESLVSETSSSLLNIQLIQQKDISERILKFTKATEFWNNE